MTDLDVMLRWKATAQTWFRKAVHRLAYTRDEVPAVSAWLVSYEATRLLSSVLETAEDLVPLLHDDHADLALDAARRLADRVRDHRLALKLDQTAGRTPAEADAFRDKAAALRSGA